MAAARWAATHAGRRADQCRSDRRRSAWRRLRSSARHDRQPVRRSRALAALTLFALGAAAGLRLGLRFLAIGSLPAARARLDGPGASSASSASTASSRSPDLWGDLAVWPLVVAAALVAAVAAPRRLPARGAGRGGGHGRPARHPGPHRGSLRRVADAPRARRAGRRCGVRRDRDAAAGAVEVGVRRSVGDRGPRPECQRGPAGRGRGGRPRAQRTVEPRMSRPGRRTRRPVDLAAAAACGRRRHQRHGRDPDARRPTGGSLGDRARHGRRGRRRDPPADAVRRTAGRRRRGPCSSRPACWPSPAARLQRVDLGVAAAVMAVLALAGGLASDWATAGVLAVVAAAAIAAEARWRSGVASTGAFLAPLTVAALIWTSDTWRAWTPRGGPCPCCWSSASRSSSCPMVEREVAAAAAAVVASAAR